MPDTGRIAVDDAPDHAVLFIPQGMGKLNSFRE
jgi:hypothetical protein